MVDVACRVGRLVVLDAIRHDYDVVLSMSHVRRVLTVDTATDRPPVIRSSQRAPAAAGDRDPAVLSFDLNRRTLWFLGPIFMKL